ncbi:MAG TPA: acyl-CoA dehydrogenase [Myxococcaceae bacterium]|nr:acyl-CoA dehydrogenase [Myxococcaceae bacterium]
MAAALNWYRADLRELTFLLLEQFNLADVVARPPYEAWGPAEARSVLQETYRFAREVLGPLNAAADRTGCRLVDGHVVTPAGFPAAWKQLYENGFKSLGVHPDHGGQGAPAMLTVLVEEMLSGSNPAFAMYPGLAFGAAELLLECGTEEQVKRFADRMFDGTWGGTMCLTEPHAGSDVGAAKTTARRQADGTYRIKGTKIYISGGDHDLTENIIHLVLARVDGAPPGTKGLSLFIVPRNRLNADGTVGQANDVSVASIEHKMGINGSATCVLNFGEADGCIGELVGGAENAGMSQMFRMMNGARIAVGIQGLAAASSAYLNAVEYARDRRQGPHYTRWKDPTVPRVPILEHPDVRRMLLDMKSHVEGIRALVMKLARHVDLSRALRGKDDDQARYHHGQVELLTPLVKAFASDEGFRICATALQVYGGAGYLKDHPVEQSVRDVKISSIYEGTNHIQAMDLVGRKLGQAGGTYLQAFLADIGTFIEAHREHPLLGKAVAALGAGQECLMSAAMGLLSWSQGGQLGLIALNANRFLGMMSRLAVGWLLLEGAAVADAARGKLADGHPDRAFYEGKVQAALWFARNELPRVEADGRLMMQEDASPLDIPDAGFAAA